MPSQYDWQPANCLYRLTIVKSIILPRVHVFCPTAVFPVKQAAMLSGHLAISALLNHYLDTEPEAVLAGTLFPDLSDKLLYGAGLTPSSRMLAHTLLGLGASTAVVWQVGDGKTARSWGLGYLGHLLADMGGFVPWFYPFVDYPFKPSTPLLVKLLTGKLKPSRLEIGLLAWAVLVSLPGKYRDS